jgi:hypothetical protein
MILWSAMVAIILVAHYQPVDAAADRATIRGEAKRASFYWQRAGSRISKIRPKRALKRQAKRLRQ